MTVRNSKSIDVDATVDTITIDVDATVDTITNYIVQCLFLLFLDNLAVAFTLQDKHNKCTLS